MSDIAETNQVKTEGDDFAVEEDDSADIKNTVHHRLRANSSIMQLKKILGTSDPLRGPVYAPIAHDRRYIEDPHPSCSTETDSLDLSQTLIVFS